MKKQDIKAGVLYGYAKGTSEYRNATPVIVLDASTLWTWSRSTSRENRQWKVSGDTRPTPLSYASPYCGGSGYLVLKANLRGTEEERAQILTNMKELYTEFAATPGNPDAVNALARRVATTGHIFVDVVNNRWITGGYTEAKNEEDERRNARDAKHKAERDRAAAERDTMDEIGALIAAKLEKPVNVMADRTWGDARASIKLNDLAAYFGVETPKERL